MIPSASALASACSHPLADDLLESGAAEPFEAVPLEAVQSSLDVDAGLVLAWLADNAADWGASDEERTQLLAAAARR